MYVSCLAGTRIIAIIPSLTRQASQNRFLYLGRFPEQIVEMFFPNNQLFCACVSEIKMNYFWCQKALILHTCVHVCVCLEMHVPPLCISQKISRKKDINVCPVKIPRAISLKPCDCIHCAWNGCLVFNTVHIADVFSEGQNGSCRSSCCWLTEDLDLIQWSLPIKISFHF